MKLGSLTCEACQGSVPIPPDPTLLSTPCPYCGRHVLLPDQADRRAALERAREAEANRQYESQRSAEREKTKRLALRWKILGSLALALAIGVPVTWFVLRLMRTIETGVSAQGDQPLGPGTAKQAGLERLGEMVTAAQVGACGELFMQPKLGDGRIEARFTLADRSCARLLATSGDPEALLAMTIVGGDGRPVDGPAKAHELDHLYCPRALGGTHQITVTAEGAILSLAAVACDRSYPTDPVGTGAARVTELMKERRAAGCTEIMSPAKTYLGDQTITATINRNTCVQIIVATGMDDNDVSIELTNPLGEKAPAPPPGKEGVLTYCATEGGAHSGRMIPALAGPFSSATLICPKRALP